MFHMRHMRNDYYQYYPHRNFIMGLIFQKCVLFYYSFVVFDNIIFLLRSVFHFISRNRKMASNNLKGTFFAIFCLIIKWFAHLATNHMFNEQRRKFYRFMAQVTTSNSNIHINCMNDLHGVKTRIDDISVMNNEQ